MQETSETWVRSPGWEDPLEEGMATHSNILAWRIPVTEEPGGLPSMRSHRVGNDFAAAAAAAAVHRYQKGLEQSGRITQVTVKQYFST